MAEDRMVRNQFSNLTMKDFDEVFEYDHIHHPPNHLMLGGEPFAEVEKIFERENAGNGRGKERIRIRRRISFDNTNNPPPMQTHSMDATDRTGRLEYRDPQPKIMGKPEYDSNTKVGTEEHVRTQQQPALTPNHLPETTKADEPERVAATENEKDAMIRSLLKQIEELQNGEGTQKKERRRSSRKDKQRLNSRDNCAVHGPKNRVQFEQPQMQPPAQPPPQQPLPPQPQPPQPPKNITSPLLSPTVNDIFDFIDQRNVPLMNQQPVHFVDPHMQSFRQSVDTNMKNMNEQFAKLKSELDRDREERLKMQQDQMRRLSQLGNLSFEEFAHLKKQTRTTGANEAERKNTMKHLEKWKAAEERRLNGGSGAIRGSDKDMKIESLLQEINQFNATGVNGSMGFGQEQGNASGKVHQGRGSMKSKQTEIQAPHFGVDDHLKLRGSVRKELRNVNEDLAKMHANFELEKQQHELALQRLKAKDDHIKRLNELSGLVLGDWAEAKATERGKGEVMDEQTVRNECQREGGSWREENVGDREKDVVIGALMQEVEQLRKENLAQKNAQWNSKKENLNDFRQEEEKTKNTTADGGGTEKVEDFKVPNFQMRQEEVSTPSSDDDETDDDDEGLEEIIINKI